MTKAEIWGAIAKQPMTPQGMAERLRLLELIPDDLTEDEEQHEHKKTSQSKIKPLRALEPNWYHGLTRIGLERWIQLREVGLIADLAWWGGDRATGIRCHRLRLVEPMQCRPVPDGYTGKLHDKGMW